MAEALGLAASVIAVVDLFVKVGVLCSVYCADVKRAPRDVRLILNEADRLTATLKDLERLLTGPNGAKFASLQNVQRSVADCQRQLRDLDIKLREGTKYKRAVWPLKKQEVADIVAGLERCRHAISLDLHVNQTSLLLDIHQEVVLAKLRTAEGATFDSNADAENARCHPHTRIEILDRIEAWATARDNEAIFWLNGQAGTGKSTISRTVAQKFADKGTLGASFFFKRGEGDRGRTALFFTTIAAQLVRQLPGLAVYVRDALEADPIIHEKSLKDQFDRLIQDPIEKLPLSQDPALVLVVVDALDECGSVELQARRIIYLLSQAKRLTTVRLKIFITSRPELPIRLGFKDIDSEYEVYLLQQTPLSIIRHDVTAFLQDKLAIIKQDYNKSVTSNRQLPSEWPGAEQITQMVEMSIPLFIVAATFCRFVQDRRLGGPKEQLSRILEHQASGTSSLDATYLPVLDRLLMGLSNSDMNMVISKFKHVIGSIVILADPLSIPSLARLLGVSIEFVEYQLDELHSVLSIPPDPETPVRLLHLSFRDFLVNPENKKDPEKYPFWIDERESHEQLAKLCLQLLLKDNTLRRDICNLRLPGICRSGIDQKIIDTALPAEVKYACRYWVYHWKESQCKIRDGSLVDRFLTHHLLDWLEVLGLLGHVREASSMMEDLLSLLEPERSDDISDFIRDARRVILSHRSIIDLYPLQVYCSAIGFAPEQSVVRKTYLNEIPEWLSFSPVDDSWDSCLQAFERHKYDILSIAFSPDSKILASASPDHIDLWDLATGTCLTTIKDPDTYSMIFLDSLVLVTVSVRSGLRYWNIVTGSCMDTLKLENFRSSVDAISLDIKLLASRSDEFRVKVWDVRTGEQLQTFEGHNERVRTLIFSPDSAMLASSDDRTVKLWDLDAGKCIATLQGCDETGTAVAFSHDSKLVAVSHHSAIKFWDISTGQYITTTLNRESKFGVASIRFSHDSRLLAASYMEATFCIWNIARGECTFILKNSWVNSQSCDFSSDSLLLATSSLNAVKLWDITTLNDTPETPVSDLTTLKFAHNSKLLAHKISHSIEFYDVTTSEYTTAIDQVNSNQFRFSHDATQLLVLQPPSIQVWDVKEGKCIRTLPKNPWTFDSPFISFSVRDFIAVSHDLSLLAIISDLKKRIALWDASTGKCIASYGEHDTPIHSVIFSDDSTLLASVADYSPFCDNENIKIWDVATGECKAAFGVLAYPCDTVALSHDLRFLAVGGMWVHLCDIDTGACREILEARLTIDYLAFDITDSFLHTNIGMFKLNDTVRQIHSTPGAEMKTEIVPHGPEDNPSPHSVLLPSIERQGVGISEDGTWITWDSQRIIWLPPNYRPDPPATRGGNTAVIESSVAIVRSGRMIHIKISPRQDLSL